MNKQENHPELLRSASLVEHDLQRLTPCMLGFFSQLHRQGQISTATLEHYFISYKSRFTEAYKERGQFFDGLLPFINTYLREVRMGSSSAIHVAVANYIQKAFIIMNVLQDLEQRDR